MAPLQIGLRISGTKQRRAGFAPLVSVGVLAGNEGENMYISPIITENPAYIIKHTPEYILYQFINRNARPFDADASGSLSIAMTIHKDYRIKDGKSPYTLLKEAYDLFVANYTTLANDGRLVFKDTEADPESFHAIVNQYPLEPHTGTYIPMNPQGLTGTLCVPADKLEEFFRDTQYKEFAQFKDIEVGVACQSIPGLENIIIPRPVYYEVVVNGEPTGVSLSRPSDSFMTHARNTEFIEYTNVSFTLQEVLSAGEGRLIRDNATITVDTVKSRILCELGKKEISYNIVVEWKGATEQEYDNVKHLMKSNKSRLVLNGQDITPLAYTNQQATISASKTRNLRAAINPRTMGVYAIDAETSTDANTRTLSVIITLTKRQTAATGVGPRDYSNAGNNLQRSNGGQPNNGYNNAYDRNDHNDPYNQPQSTNQPKSGWDIKNLAVGFIAGLVVGILCMFLIDTVFGGEEKKQEEYSNNTTTVEIPEGNNELTTGDNEPQETSTVTHDETSPDPVANPEPKPEQKQETKPQPTPAPQPNADNDRAEREKIAKQKEQEAQKKADAQKQENQKKADAKASIMRLIKKGEKIENIRNKPAFAQLSSAEQMDVEWYVDFNRMIEKDYQITKEKRKLKNNVYSKGINSWEDLTNGRKSIPSVVNDSKSAE